MSYSAELRMQACGWAASGCQRHPSGRSATFNQAKGQSVLRSTRPHHAGSLTGAARGPDHGRLPHLRLQTEGWRRIACDSGVTYRSTTKGGTVKPRATALGFMSEPPLS